MAAATVQSSTNLFRRLAWNATVPLEIRLADAEGSLVDRYYVRVVGHRDSLPWSTGVVNTSHAITSPPFSNGT